MKESTKMGLPEPGKTQIPFSSPQNSILNGEELELQSQPANLPKLSPKPGYQTTQGHFTGIFILVSLMLSIFGYYKSPEQIETWIQLINTVLTIVVPLLGSIPVLNNYVNSRGKIQSNALWASAELSKGPEQGTAINQPEFTRQELIDALSLMRADIKKLVPNNQKGQP